jgi:hypothetical protein
VAEVVTIETYGFDGELRQFPALAWARRGGLVLHDPIGIDGGRGGFVVTQERTSLRVCSVPTIEIGESLLEALERFPWSSVGEAADSPRVRGGLGILRGRPSWLADVKQIVLAGGGSI